MDAILFEVAEFFVAFKRQYKPGEALRESDLDSWDAGKDDMEREIATLLATGKLAKPERAPPEPMPDMPEPVHAGPVYEERV